MESTTSRDISKLYVPIAIVIGALIIGLGLYFGLSSRQSAAAATQATQQGQAAVDVSKVKTDGEPYIGDLHAPVTLAAWTDYQCPFCRAVETGHPDIPTKPAMPQLLSQYVNAGKVRIVFKDFAFLGPDSTMDAEYGRAIWELYPTQFFAWREAMYKAQPQENSLSTTANEAHVIKVTSSVSGIDAQKVKAQVAAKKSQYDASIDADKQEGSAFGINGTPGFITGTAAINGAEDFAAFQAAIDPQLK